MAYKNKHDSGFIYIWFDRKHKRFYVGCHWGTPEDGYICSSRWMRKAYKRRPEDFRRRILETITTTPSDLYECEYKWLSMIKDEELGTRYYNLKRTHHKFFNYDNSASQTEDAKAKRSASLKATYNTPEKKAEQAARAKEMWSNPEHADKISSAMKKNWEETREERITSLVEAQNRPEVKEKISKSTKERWEDPAYRENHIEKRKGRKLRPRTEEQIEANRLIQQQLWSTEEHQKKMSESHLNSVKAREQSKINIQKTKSPEAIEKMAETKRRQHEERMKDPVAYEAFKQKCREAAQKRWGRIEPRSK